MKKKQLAWSALAMIWAASSASADNVFWQGGAGNFGDANYYDTNFSIPDTVAIGGDWVYLGDNGDVTNSIGSFSVGKLFVGHNQSGGYAGAGTLNITGGTITTSAGAGGAGNSGVVVGLSNNGTLNIDSSSGFLDINRQMSIGYGNNATQSGTVNLTNGGKLTVEGGNLSLGESNNGGAGIAGHINVNGTLWVENQILLGVRAGSTFVQTGGKTTVKGGGKNDADMVVGQNNADNTSFALSGGTFTVPAITIASTTTSGVSTDNVAFTVSGGTLTLTGLFDAVAGNASGTHVTFSGGKTTIKGGFNVDSGDAAINTTVTFSGGTTAITGSFIAATNGSHSSGTTINFSGNAVFSNTSNFVIADNTSNSNNATVNISNNAHVSVGGSVGLFLGRGNSTNTTLNMSGGQLDIASHLLLGTADKGATGIVVNHSGGTITTGQGLKVDDTTTGTATYNLSGTGSIAVTGLGVVGRQHGTGIMNQTGGSAAFNGKLHIGDSEPDTTKPVDTGLYANGTYNLSGGTLTAAGGSATSDAFAIAPAGTGTFRIYGSDATMSVNGNMKVNANTYGSSAVGTLAYVLQPGESLTTIQVSGTATFSAGSVLSFDTGGVTPATSYDLVTASSIVNAGLTLSAPSGWHLDVLEGSSSKTLQIFTALAGDANRNGTIDADDYTLIDRGYAMQLDWWHNGDFNDNGVVDSSDYMILDQSFVQQGGVLSPGLLADRESRFGSDYTAALLASVPEPTGLSVVGLGLASVLTRRRRQAR